MQRSSTILLGPKRKWSDEAKFYDLLRQRIREGSEFYHVVSLEGVSRHYRDKEVYPQASDAIDQLTEFEGQVCVDGPRRTWALKKVDAEADKDLKPDRQARTFIVEHENGLAEAVLVFDLGGMQTAFLIRGPGMSRFLTECVHFYHTLCPLRWKDLEAIFGRRKDRPNESMHRTQ